MKARKSTSKPKSITSDTRLTNSNILNFSSFQNTNLQKSIDPRDNYFNSNIQDSEKKEVQFLRFKNRQLQERVKRLTSQNKSLQENKKQLLALNIQYVNVVNRYYEDTNKITQKKKNPEAKVLESLERDHRNLVRHCLAMEGQIKNYTQEMSKFQEMKNQLKQANHTSVKELFEELLDLADQNKDIKKKINHVTFELEKGKLEYQNIRKAHSEKQKEAGNSEQEIAKMLSLVNSVKQESADKSNAYESRIYELQIKVQKLERELRRQQETASKSVYNKRVLEMRQVEHVHEYDKLQKSLKSLVPRGKSLEPRNSLEKTKSTIFSKQQKNKKSFIGKLGQF